MSEKDHIEKVITGYCRGLEDALEFVLFELAKSSNLTELKVSIEKHLALVKNHKLVILKRHLNTQYDEGL
jgi:hypothetical protein